MDSESPSRCFSQFSTFMILMGRRPAPAVSEVEKKKKNQTRISVEGRKGLSLSTVMGCLEMTQEGLEKAVASKEEHGNPLTF